MAGAFMYMSEIQSLRGMIYNPEEICSVYYSNIGLGNLRNLSEENPLDVKIQWQNP